MSDNSTCFVISDIFQNDAIGLCAGINLNKILNSIVLHRTFKICLWIPGFKNIGWPLAWAQSAN